MKLFLTRAETRFVVLLGGMNQHPEVLQPQLRLYLLEICLELKYKACLNKAWVKTVKKKKPFHLLSGLNLRTAAAFYWR